MRDLYSDFTTLGNPFIKLVRRGFHSIARQEMSQSFDFTRHSIGNLISYLKIISRQLISTNILAASSIGIDLLQVCLKIKMFLFISFKVSSPLSYPSFLWNYRLWYSLIVCFCSCECLFIAILRLRRVAFFQFNFAALLDAIGEKRLFNFICPLVCLLFSFQFFFFFHYFGGSWESFVTRISFLFFFFGYNLSRFSFVYFDVVKGTQYLAPLITGTFFSPLLLSVLVFFFSRFFSCFPRSFFLKKLSNLG